MGPARRSAGLTRLSSKIDEAWVADMDKRRFQGKALLDSAKVLIARHA